MSITAAGFCSVPLTSEGKDRGMLKEQELADVQRDQDMQMDTEGLQDMPMEVQGVQDTTMNVQEMSDGLQYMRGVSRQLMTSLWLEQVQKLSWRTCRGCRCPCP